MEEQNHPVEPQDERPAPVAREPELQQDERTSPRLYTKEIEENDPFLDEGEGASSPTPREAVAEEKDAYYLNGAVEQEGAEDELVHSNGRQLLHDNDFWQDDAPVTEEAASAPEDERKTNWKAIVHEIVETAVLTLLIFVLMRALIQNYRIEGYSMEPNLHEGQYLIVNKASYYFGDPQRGDIIVFEFPKGDPNGPEKDYIKRVIGLPGDTVECRPNEILVNGEVIEEPYGPNPSSYYCSPVTLGPDEYFVLGDNRNQSSDSHSWGTLGRKWIIGKAWLVYWPLTDLGVVPAHAIDAPEPATTVLSR